MKIKALVLAIFLFAAPLPKAGAGLVRPSAEELKDFELCELSLRSLKEKGPCIPAKVPGDVFTALMKAGRIPDPYKDMNSKKVQWVDRRAWLYQTTFNYLPKPGRRLHLLFMGLDYISRVSVNGQVLVPRREGMFSRVDLDITDALNPRGDQNLSVILFGLPGRSKSWLGKFIGTAEFERRRYLKTQMSFDWDFAPRLKGAGIWDRVFLYETGPAALKDLFIRTDNRGKVEVKVELQDPAPERALLLLQIGEERGRDNIAAARVPIEKGAVEVSALLQVSKPKLWWPWDMGEQNLYRLTARVIVGGEKSDQVSELFGFREISWGPNPEAPPGSADWVLFVNGKREFMRGANWVPPESMPGRMDDSRYEKLIRMAKEAGVNLLRVWGGGNRERRAFYEFCDREGVMVWQEFPFACVFLLGYPRTQKFQELVRQEADEIVRQLVNHPSLIMWCGGNEFNVSQNLHVVRILEEVTGSLDPSRRFIPASPYKGDNHNWVVWHNYGNLEDYFSDTSPFPSEFGLQAFPALSTIEKWLSPEYRWPIGKVYIHHDLGKKKMDKYAAAAGYENNLESYAQATRLVQAHFLQRGIENWRQRKYKTSGAAFWQLNEPWPAFSWAVIDYELVPKPAYYALKNSYNPLLMSARFEERKWGPGDDFRAELVVVNDYHREFMDALVQAEVCGESESLELPLIPEDAVVSAGELSIKIPDSCARPRLSLRLVAEAPGGEKTVSRNQYDLWIYDPRPAGERKRKLQQMSMRLMSGARPEKE